MAGRAADEHGKPGLEIDADPKFQRITWTIQRVGWAVMGVIVVAALAGAFGSGALSSASLTDPTGAVEIRYERLQRHFRPWRLEVRIGTAATAGQTVRVHVGQNLLRSVDVRGIVPEPREVAAGARGMVFVFQVLALGEPMSVRFDLESRRAGIVRGEIGLAGQEPARFTQFVYP